MLKWIESFEYVELEITCCQKAAIKIHGTFYRNQREEMRFSWTDYANKGQDEINITLNCDVNTAKKIMRIYHEYAKAYPSNCSTPKGFEDTPESPTEKPSAYYVCVSIPNPANKIGAIKLVRELTRFGLKEAKDLVDGCDIWLGGLQATALCSAGFDIRMQSVIPTC